MDMSYTNIKKINIFKKNKAKFYNKYQTMKIIAKFV